MKFAAITLVTGLASIAFGTDFPVDEGSTTSVQGLISAILDGTLIGDWDEEGNPEGTRTIPGLWGGSGNNAIPMDMVFNIPLDFTGDVSGSMSIDIKTAPGVCVMQDLDWDLLGNGEASAAITMTVQFETFHTEQPNALFIGDFPVEIPLDESQITETRFEQIGPAVGTSVDLPDAPGVFEIQAVVGGLLHVTVDMLGTPAPVQLPVIGTIEGTYAIDADGETVHLMAAFAVDESFDAPAQPLPTIPLELPTIVPPGDVAGVLLDLTPQSVTVQAEVDAAITGHVDSDTVPGDVTGDGLVNTDDILAVLSAWGQCKGCAADLDNDGLVGVNDILIIIEYWS